MATPECGCFQTCCLLVQASRKESHDDCTSNARHIHHTRTAERVRQTHTAALPRCWPVSGLTVYGRKRHTPGTPSRYAIAGKPVAGCAKPYCHRELCHTIWNRDIGYQYKPLTVAGAALVGLLPTFPAATAAGSVQKPSSFPLNCA